MMRSFTTLVLVAVLAASGSKSSASNPTPSELASSGDPTAAGSDAPSERPRPAELEQPADPAKAEPGRSPSPSPAQPAKADPKAELFATEASAWQAARPVFTKYCATCHAKDGKKATRKKLDHFDMATYPLGGHHTATIGFTIRDVLGISGKKPTMPYDKPGLVKGDELAAVKAWTDAWEAAEKGGAHPAAESHHP